MLKVSNLTKTYAGSASGIFGITNQFKKGEVVCILGPSGAGKSTLLRILAGLEPYDAGTIEKEGAIAISYVPQEYTLWPHCTVIENILLASSIRYGSNTEIAQRAHEMLARFGLEECVDKFPHELSGGQKQRVALLRAIINKPDILLLDEVTSALDPELTKSVLDLIRALANDGYTMVIVTHHMSFAMSVADRILFVSDGILVADEPSYTFFTAQTNPIIKSFIQNIAKKDDSIEIFKGKKQFQAYHMNLIRTLPECSTIYVAGAVGNRWFIPMENRYDEYEKIRIEKRITWKMVAYELGIQDKKLLQTHPATTRIALLPQTLENPANYNVFGDTVITQIFDIEPTIIQIKNPAVAASYSVFFEELWHSGSEVLAPDYPIK